MVTEVRYAWQWNLTFERSGLTKTVADDRALVHTDVAGKAFVFNSLAPSVDGDAGWSVFRNGFAKRIAQERSDVYMCAAKRLVE